MQSTWRCSWRQTGQQIPEIRTAGFWGSLLISFRWTASGGWLPPRPGGGWNYGGLQSLARLPEPVGGQVSCKCQGAMETTEAWAEPQTGIRHSSRHLLPLSRGIPMTEAGQSQEELAWLVCVSATGHLCALSEVFEYYYLGGVGPPQLYCIGLAGTGGTCLIGAWALQCWTK